LWPRRGIAVRVTRAAGIAFASSIGIAFASRLAVARTIEFCLGERCDVRGDAQ
jgi:hypothetical protein